MKLSISLVSNALTAPILSGEVGLNGVELQPTKADRVDANTRAMMRMEYDIAEMSLATFVKMREDGAPLIGLPIFTGRRFAEPGMGVRPGAGIEKPDQLKGKRVGVPQYWMTSSVWHRAVLEEFYNVPASEIDWVTVQDERFDDREPADGSHFDYREGGSLVEMINAGELDAILFPRPIADRFDPKSTRCLFNDVCAAQRAFFGKTKIFPIMHFVVAQEAVLNDNPGLAAKFVALFEDIKDRFIADPDRANRMESPLYGGEFEPSLALFKGDAWPSGIDANRDVLDWFLDRAQHQGLTKNRLDVDTLFAV